MDIQTADTSAQMYRKISAQAQVTSRVDVKEEFDL